LKLHGSTCIVLWCWIKACPSWQSPTANNRINTSQSEYYQTSTLCFHYESYLTISSKQDAYLTVSPKHDFYGSLWHINHCKFKTTWNCQTPARSRFTESKEDPCPHCGVASTLINNSGYSTLIADLTLDLTCRHHTLIVAWPSMGMTLLQFASFGCLDRVRAAIWVETWQ
jgi:hypothetical protein